MSDKKIVTNGDKVRAMSDKELAEKASRSITCLWCPVGDCCGCGQDECKEALLTWLRSPVEESEK